MREIMLSTWTGPEVSWEMTSNGQCSVLIDGVRVTEETRLIGEGGWIMAIDSGPFDVETNDATNEMLTPLEHEAMSMTADLWNMLTKIVGDDKARHGDLGELCGHIHSIQRAIMAQAACRAYPDRYRLLGAGPLQTGTDNG